MYLDEIVKEIKYKDQYFTKNKKYGKIKLVISYKEGKYLCDDIDNVITHAKESIRQ